MKSWSVLRMICGGKSFLDSVWHKSVGFCEKLPNNLSNVYYTERPKLCTFTKAASE